MWLTQCIADFRDRSVDAENALPVAGLVFMVLEVTTSILWAGVAERGLVFVPSFFLKLLPAWSGPIPYEDRATVLGSSAYRIAWLQTLKLLLHATWKTINLNVSLPVREAIRLMKLFFVLCKVGDLLFVILSSPGFRTIFSLPCSINVVYEWHLECMCFL